MASWIKCNLCGTKMEGEYCLQCNPTGDLLTQLLLMDRAYNERLLPKHRRKTWYGRAADEIEALREVTDRGTDDNQQA